jgi:hypothetical protein
LIFLSFAAILFTANRNPISEFKATGTDIEAKTREVLQRSEVTFNELQTLAKQVGTVTLSPVTKSFSESGFNI